MPTCFVSLLLLDCLVFYCRFCAESEELYPPGEEPPGLIPFLTTQPSTPPIQSATSPTQPSTPPPSSHHHHSNSLQPLLNQPDLSPHCQTDDDDISIGKRVGTNLDFGGDLTLLFAQVPPLIHPTFKFKSCQTLLLTEIRSRFPLKRTEKKQATSAIIQEKFWAVNC